MLMFNVVQNCFMLLLYEACQLFSGRFDVLCTGEPCVLHLFKS